jgi:hypothetical protein
LLKVAHQHDPGLVRPFRRATGRFARRRRMNWDRKGLYLSDIGPAGSPMPTILLARYGACPGGRARACQSGVLLHLVRVAKAGGLLPAFV